MRTRSSNAVSLKREQFYIGIKTRSKHAVMEKIRYQYIHDEFDEFMEFIMARHLKLAIPQLELLLRMIKQNFPNAFIHLGNLVIDEKIGTMDLKAEDIYGLTSMDNQYFEWLAWVLIEHGFQFPLWALAEMAVQTLQYEGQQFRRLHTLRCLNSAMKNQGFDFYSHFFTICKDPAKALNNIATQCTSSDPKIRTEAWRVAAKIYSIDSDEIITNILNIVGVSQIKQLLTEGILSISSLIRALSIQILNNIFLCILQITDTKMHEELGSIFKQLLIMYNSESEKNSVKMEIGYLLQNALTLANYDDFQWFISNGLQELEQVHCYDDSEQDGVDRINLQLCKLMCLKIREFDMEGVFINEPRIMEMMEEL